MAEEKWGFEEEEIPGPPAGEDRRPLQGDVARRAYAIYVGRGGGQSTAAQTEDDWRRAEQELDAEK